MTKVHDHLVKSHGLALLASRGALAPLTQHATCTKVLQCRFDVASMVGREEGTEDDEMKECMHRGDEQGADAERELRAVLPGATTACDSMRHAPPPVDTHSLHSHAL